MEIVMASTMHKQSCLDDTLLQCNEEPQHHQTKSEFTAKPQYKIWDSYTQANSQLYRTIQGVGTHNNIKSKSMIDIYSQETFTANMYARVLQCHCHSLLSNEFYQHYYGMHIMYTIIIDTGQ